MIASIVYPLVTILAIIALEALTHRTVYRWATNRSIFVELFCGWKWYRRLHGGAWIRTYLTTCWIPLTEEERKEPYWKHGLREGRHYEEWP